jgi:hypothetical protein
MALSFLESFVEAIQWVLVVLRENKRGRDMMSRPSLYKGGGKEKIRKRKKKQ